jgi:1-deoxy-D-xylulose-5-phosphate reductoisomerase
MSSAEPAAPMRLSILGATGSIGTSTLDLIERHPGRFIIEAVTAHSNATALAALARRVGARLAVVADPGRYRDLAEALAGSGTVAAAGAEALVEAAARPTDCVMAAIVGAAGLAPTLAAVGATRRLALANKECLVTAGPVFMGAIARAGIELLPVDSEHAGVFQCLTGQDRSAVSSVTITASGGPFRTWTSEQIAAARPEQALKHPNWSMGRKITIDSATLMNKGLELIEAHHLFALAPDQLGVVVHPQSIVHALVGYTDGAVVAQMAMPDMRAPIALALGWPRRMASPTPVLDLARLASLTFEAPDRARFPALAIAEAALRRGAGATAALNAANEVAVEAFLAGRLSFPGIAARVEQTLDVLEGRNALSPPADLATALALDHMARTVAAGLPTCTI